MSLHQLFISLSPNILDSFNHKNRSAYFKLLLSLIFISLFYNLHAQITSACGIYTGTGATKAITTLGFTPDVVIIKAVSAKFAFMKTTDMGSNKSVSMDGVGTLYNNAITALGTNGFTLSTNTNVNNSGTVYYFYAFKASPDFTVSTYTGDGTATRTISTSFKVAWAITVSGTANTDVGASAFMSSSSSDFRTAYNSTSGKNSNSGSGAGISPTTGFIVGQGLATNAGNILSTTYYYFAVKAVAGSSEAGTYGGTAATQTITTGLTPKFVCTLGGTDLMMRSTVTPTLDATQNFWEATADINQGFKSLGTTKFVLGTSGKVNNFLFGISQGYNYFAIGNSTILPVELTAFSGTCVPNGVQLNWTTATELYNDYFLIEKSSDGYNWATIDKVKGSMHSITTTKYVSTDESPTNGLAYYRLSQVDIDGKVTVFKAIDVDCNSSENANNQLILFPNPSSSSLNLSISAGSPSKNNSILLINNLGQVVFEENIDLVKGSNLVTFPIDLPSGSYTVLFNSTQMIIPSKKLMIINQ